MNKNIPTNPGVYIMKDNKHNVIYVGKAKNLKNRVKSYFQNSKNLNLKTRELVKHISDIEYFICNTEVEALILENNLIKHYKPKYNILLKDQKTYPYIKITKEKYPKISIVRSTKKLDEEIAAYYYGPYPHGAKFAFNTLIKVFNIRDCNLNMKNTYERPCLKYDMKLCNAPCVFKDKNTLLEYTQNIENLHNFLKKKDKSVLYNLEKEMKKYADCMEYEKAQIVKEKIEALNRLIETQIIDSINDVNQDAFVFIEEDKYINLCVLNIRNGITINKEIIKIKTINSQEDSIIQRLVTMYYYDRKAPKNIIMEYKYKEEKEILEEWFLNYKKIKIKLDFPKIKSRKMELLNLAIKNISLSK